MPIQQHTKPVYMILCSNDACAHDDGADFTLDPDGYPRYFDSERTAREWAETNGWGVHPLLCPPCAADARERREQAAEIAAAVEYALGTDL